MIQAFQDISFPLLVALILGGFVFGLVFTWTHFMMLKKYVFTQTHFKRALFILTFLRLIFFGVVLWIVINIHKSVLEVLIFFIAFTIARWLMFLRTKRLLANGKSL